LNIVVQVQVCDATMLNKVTAAGNIKTILLL
jgi:hypothetical protein